MSDLTGDEVFEYLRNMSDEENQAIDIYNAWNFYDDMSWTEALAAFTPEMMKDKKALVWYQMIWKSEQITRYGTEVAETEGETLH